MEKTFRGVLYCDTSTGKMRLTRGRGRKTPYEIAVLVRVQVEMPPEKFAELSARVQIPEAVVRAFQEEELPPSQAPAPSP